MTKTVEHKILFVRTASNEINLNQYNLQGVGLGKAFVDLGYDFDYIYLSKKDEYEKIVYENNGHRLMMISKHRIRVFRTGICPKICSREFLSQYEYVISCEYGQYMTYLLSKNSDNVIMYSGPYYNLFKIPVTSYAYDALYTKAENENIKYKFVKSVLAKEFLEEKGYDNVHVVGVGLDTDGFKEEVKKDSKVEKIEEYMKNNKCLLYVGAISDRKNFPFLIQVFKEINKMHPDIKLVIVGKGDRSYIKKYTKDLDKQQRESIKFAGAVDNKQLRYIYPLAKVFLLPSKQEIFGMVLLEAMYLGTPVISSLNGGSKTMINTDENGIVIEDFDVDKWVEAINKYLTDIGFRNEILHNARKTIEDNYTWDKIAQKMLAVIGEEK
ncbi:MAG: glycosyltransferase family 4 protein [Lachnospiraceae bacterium]|nr:glycosyltransferase family 4 protein [Lachnospiraceae bacterium]